MSSRRNTAPDKSEAELSALLRLKMLCVPDAQLNKLLPDYSPLELVRKFCNNVRDPVIEKRIELGLAEILRTHTTLVTVADAEYPSRLAPLAHERPPILFCRGNIDLFETPTIAIVGTRRSTEYGNSAADMLAHDLARAGATIISGLALGIDAHAHQGALSADGNTIAVLGCGIDVLYPRRNARLQHRIAEAGLVISEFAPGEPALAHHFLYRNRIIAALSSGVVVVEAGMRSGSSNTMGWALGLGIEGFAVPGPIGREASVGTNALIQCGATMVTSVADILEALHWKVEPAEAGEPTPGPKDRQAARILELLGPVAVQVDQIARNAQCNTARALALLAELELDGFVRQLPGKQFVRTDMRTARE